jgi:hypothetical protein
MSNGIQLPLFGFDSTVVQSRFSCNLTFAERSPHVKTCTKCQVCKSLSDFRGQRSTCRQCDYHVNRAYKQRNQLAVSQYNREYLRDYYLRYKEKSKEKGREWRQKNIESFRAHCSKYYQENRDRILANVKQRAQKNKKARSVYVREWMRLRRQNDPVFRMICALRHRVNMSLQGQGRSSTMDLLGIDIKGLRAYLQSLFLEGMSWVNYGEWHVDHIVSIKHFKDNYDMSDPAIQRRCFHYTNLQPLWAIDNMSKGAKIV